MFEFLWVWWYGSTNQTLEDDKMYILRIGRCIYENEIEWIKSLGIIYLYMPLNTRAYIRIKTRSQNIEMIKNYFGDQITITLCTN